ncbi:hypothetical protein B0I37DRAFT_416822 [Chaetomium sp. MPI-CAGE-AT-0009]|nr:hypothetical protein B0I37DRAFT_416822 [Chaetomium sp. MPI-CAGE-AT-0009]
MPQISQAEMTAFHEAHFSKLATDHFQAHFLRPDHPPAEETTYHAADDEEYYEEYYEEEDDGLGYYPDGVKRTLTDEQIAIFRHSEIEALRRARKSSNSGKSTTMRPEEDAAHGLSEDGEPIDLRKRTWDVVDKGLATLDYGEENNEPVDASAIQRRRISYDD